MNRMSLFVYNGHEGRYAFIVIILYYCVKPLRSTARIVLSSYKHSNLFRISQPSFLGGGGGGGGNETKQTNKQNNLG
jgi:hypothetical protein